MSGVEVFGLKNCDSCRKALKALVAAGRDAVLVDVRATPLSAKQLEGFVGALGVAIVNRRSPSWRALSDAERAQADDLSAIPTLLLAHPTVMKRPVISAEGHILLGWTAETQAALGLST